MPSPKFESVAIYCHQKPEKAFVETLFLRELVRFLYANGVQHIAGDQRTSQLLQKSIIPIDSQKKYDLKIGIGGDGTLLKMIRELQKNDGLFLGINFGTLGFLSELTPENALEKLKTIFAGNFLVDARKVLKVTVSRRDLHGKKNKIFRAYALNEVTLGHGGQARLTNFHITSQSEYIGTFRADGIIFATPTGSTAYSMSAGGPIVSPDIEGTIITPVSPHTLTQRPVLVPADADLHIRCESRVESISLTVDGQIYFVLNPTDQILVQTATRTARFIRLEPTHYFNALRQKLGWGDAI